MSPRDKVCGNAFRSCGRFAARRWPLLVVAISLLASAGWASLGFGLNLSPSAPRGLYRRVSDPLTRGVFVVACLPSTVGAFGRARGYLGLGDCPGRAQPVLKRVGAVAGDVVVLERDVISVNGAPVVAQRIARLDSLGRPVPHVPFGSYPVGQGHVWLFGRASSRSWDSRYFGPVDVDGVRGVVRPVITAPERQTR